MRIFIAALLTSYTSIVSAAGYSFTPLGYLPGGTAGSEAFAVSADGSVIVGQTSSPNYLQAFRWTRQTGIVGIGFLPGHGESMANAVSADGSTVVGWSAHPLGRPQAFRWTSATGMTALGTLAGGTESQAFDVSADGSLVVGKSTSRTRTNSEAFRWTNSTGMVRLGDFPGETYPYIAQGVSANGAVIIGSAIAPPGGEAYRWTQSDGMVGLGGFPGALLASEAWDVSADGSVIVGSSPSTRSAGREAFRWTRDGGMVGLGDLPGESFYSQAFGISGDGTIVVGKSDAIRGESAFIWTQSLGMVDLRDCLIAHGVQGLEGWRLFTANAISADGFTIVGRGRGGSLTSDQAWVATIPEPSTILLAALALATLTLVRLTRRHGALLSRRPMLTGCVRLLAMPKREGVQPESLGQNPPRGIVNAFNLDALRQLT